VSEAHARAVLGGGVSPVYQVGGGPEAPNQTTTGDRGDFGGRNRWIAHNAAPGGVYMVNAIAVVQNDDDDAVPLRLS